MASAQTLNFQGDNWFLYQQETVAKVTELLDCRQRMPGNQEGAGGVEAHSDRVAPPSLPPTRLWLNSTVHRGIRRYGAVEAM